MNEMDSPEEYSLFIDSVVFTLGIPFCWWVLWRFRGRTERARAWIPRTSSDENVQFFILPTFALCAFAYGVNFPLRLIGNEWLWAIVGLTLFPSALVAMVMCPVCMTLGEYIPAPRCLIPRWSYDPRKGHPFHIKIYKVKCRSDA